MGDESQKTDEQKKIEELEAQLTDSQAKNEELTTQLTESQAKNTDLEATIADLRIKNERLFSLAGQKKEDAKAEVAEKPKRTKPEVEADGQKYKFRFSAFAFEGTMYLASDASIDENLIKKIIATKGQTILKQIF